MNKHFFRALVRDTRNRLRYGQVAPKYGEKLCVEASQCQGYLPSAAVERQFGHRLRQASGLVVTAWPETELVPVEDHPKVSSCLRHWLDGMSWEESGAYDYMMQRLQSAPNGHFDGCGTLDDVKARYERLDELFTNLRQGDIFKGMAQLSQGNFREVGGVLFHIGPKGEPVFGGGGAHRFAMAKVLGLTIPAQVGVVHEAAIPLLNQYRC